MINRILLFHAFVVCFATTTIAQNYTEGNFLIDYEGLSVTETLTVESQHRLQLLLQNVSTEEEIVQIEIRAHAESRDLGERRLEPFAQFFEKQGIPTEKIELITQLDNKNRVHIKVRSSLKKNVLAPKESVVVSTKKSTVDKVYCTGASKKAAVFSIAAHSNIDIKGKEGTEVYIDRQDLVYEDGQAVHEPIQVELKEFYTPSDILLAELHTMEGDKVLETGGMLNLKITANGKALGLRSGKTAKIKMPAKSAKTKKGMHLYLGKTMENGAVDWRLQERSEPLPDPSIATNATLTNDAAADFNPNAYLQLKTTLVVDSVTILKVPVNPKTIITNNRPGYARKRVEHTHEEEYFDLELPYLNSNIVDGVWVNVDKRIQDPLAPKPVEILVQVNAVPNKGLTVDGEMLSYTPKVALMLKSRAVFLRGNMITENTTIQARNIKFQQVPRNEEVVLVAFLDTGKEIFFASKSVRATKNLETPVLVLKPMSKLAFNAAMAAVAN